LKPIRLILLQWLLLSGLCVFVIGCSPAHKQPEPYPPAGWHKLDTGAFSIYAPEGWSFRHVMSVDSYMGQFVGDGIALGFDVGWFTEHLDDSQRGAAYLLTDESIGGLPAKLARPKTSGRGRTAVYFPKLRGSEGRLYISGQDLTAAQQELVLKIFHTIRFTDADPSHDDSGHGVR
jgi:hypothetical protein